MERSKMSLVDPAWEYLDPTPDIFAMFQEFDKTFFNCTMDRVELKWSKRMTSCAGLMAPLEGKGGACSIRLSEPLLKLRPRKDLVQTLLHEMIHAHLHVTRVREGDPHGPKFKEHMHRINKIAGTNITVYHDFHDEVNLHKQHWWRCNGPCRNWKPYYGWVKRATNRAPAKNDFWWARHQQTCGGQYIKVKEPEGYGKKKEAQTQKSLGKNGNLLSQIKKKYNGNRPVSTVNSPKLTDMWNKKSTNINSPKTPLRTNSSNTLIQTKTSTQNNKNITDIWNKNRINVPSPKFPPKTNNSTSPIQTKSSPPSVKNTNSPSSSTSGTGVTLGTNDSCNSMNSILGQLHKENMERRRKLLEKNNNSTITHGTKGDSQSNHVGKKPTYIDLTESRSQHTLSSKNNQNSPLISKKPNSPNKQITQGSTQKSIPKIPQSLIANIGKPLKDRNLPDNKRSFLSSKVDHIEKSSDLSFKTTDKKAVKSHLYFPDSSHEKKNSSFSSNHVSSSDRKPLLSSSHNSSSNITQKMSSPESKSDHLLLSKKDTEASLLLLKKKRKRLLDSSNSDSSPDKNASSSKSLKQYRTTSSDLSSRLNPDFFTPSSYREKRPLFNDTSSKNSLSSNEDRKPSINSLNSSLSSLIKERKLSTTGSGSSLSPDHRDRKYSTSESSFPTVNKARNTISNSSSSHLSNHKEKSRLNSSSSHSRDHKEKSKIISSSSHIPMKRHSSSDTSPSHSPFKHKKVSLADPNFSPKYLSSPSPEKNHSPMKSHSSQHPDKSKLIEQLFGDDSDSEMETDKMNSPKLKFPKPSSSSSSSAFTPLNTTKTPQKSKSTLIKINRIENYFNSPMNDSSEDESASDNNVASSGRISQSQTSVTMVACPICQKKVPEIKINIHLDECLNMSAIGGST